MAPVQWRAPNGSRVWPGIAVADLTGDGDLEIIVGRGSDQVTVYNHSGGVEWTRNPSAAAKSALWLLRTWRRMGN